MRRLTIVPVVSVSVVFLTMGDRPIQLATAIRAVRSQTGVMTEVVLVVNGGVPISAELRACVDLLVELEENVGIPAGRNCGLAAASHDLVAFLDDDGILHSSDALLLATAHFDAEDVAVVGMKIVDEYGQTARRHIPRLGKKGVSLGGDVALFLGGAAVIRVAAFDAVGGFDGRLFYSMEETDLSWRIVAAQFRIVYEPRALFEHPRTLPNRHSGHLELTSRNRLIIAHKSLPVAVAAIYVVNWLVISSVRSRDPMSVLRGVMQGWHDRSSDRAPISWAAVLKLSSLGRPPIV